MHLLVAYNIITSSSAMAERQRELSDFKKGKEMKSIYTALFYQASQSAQTWITQFYLQITPCLPFLRKRSCLYIRHGQVRHSPVFLPTCTSYSVSIAHSHLHFYTLLFIFYAREQL